MSNRVIEWAAFGYCIRSVVAWLVDTDSDLLLDALMENAASEETDPPVEADSVSVLVDDTPDVSVTALLELVELALPCPEVLASDSPVVVAEEVDLPLLTPEPLELPQESPNPVVSLQLRLYELKFEVVWEEPPLNPRDGPDSPIPALNPELVVLDSEEP